jgi:hypothetical protein
MAQGIQRWSKKKKPPDLRNNRGLEVTCQPEGKGIGGSPAALRRIWGAAECLPASHRSS